MPGSLLKRCSPLPAYSVAPCCVTRYCSGESLEMALRSFLYICISSSGSLGGGRSAREARHPPHAASYSRSDLKPARTSSEKIFGCSQAAKCPPFLTLL